MPELKAAVIGAGGGRGRGWLRKLKSYRKIKGYDINVVAACDRLEKPLQQSANLFKVTPYLDYHKMFEKEDLDLVIIATPHYIHAPMSIAAAEHDVNVLVEKIMCINLEQADAMRTAVEKSGIKLAVGFQHRFDKKYNIIKDVIESGDIGDVFQVNMNYHWWRTENYYLNSTPVPENEDDDIWEGWRGHWKTEGAGALSNQMIHFMDLFQWFAPGDLQNVMAMSRVSKHTLTETDDNTNAICDFSKGAMGNLQAGVAYQYGKLERFEVYGTDGALIFQNRGLKRFLGIPTHWVDMRKKSLKAKKRLSSYGGKLTLNSNKMLVKNLVEAIKEDDSSIISCDVEEGRKSVELMRAILLSEKEERKITVPFEDQGEFPDLKHTYVDPKFEEFL